MSEMKEDAMWTLLIVLGLSANALACQKGYEPDPRGSGYCVESSVSPDNKKWVSDEKPPQTHQDPWRAEGVKLIDAPNMRDVDWKQDLERAKADADGKKAAGL